MPVTANKKFLTCRYWALGPQCPNFDAFGASTCIFAHWDTGRLASHFEQRGTCVPWRVLGYCGRGVGCWYEHRQTGVSGLFQETIELKGLELQIADAANKAGFNTLNHEALFELIWAVKRVGLRAGTIRTDQFTLPPKSIYPDRYRPQYQARGNGPKKRKPRKRQTPNHAVELEFHPIPPLMRKRTLKNSQEGNLIDLTLSDDGSDKGLRNASTKPAKRVKITNEVNSQRPTLIDIDIPEPRLISSNANLVDVSEKAPKCAISNPGQVQKTQKKLKRAEPEISKQLLLVKSKLEEARKSMNTCQAVMKTLFDVHYEKFDDDDVMLSLQKLSNIMNSVYDGGKNGAAEIDNAMSLLT